jgi:hypothetical protein
VDGSSIPRYIDYPVKNRDDWKRLKKRLDPRDPARFPGDWRLWAAKNRNRDTAFQLGFFPYGLFGTLRDMMGAERLLVSFYDEPELIHDMMTTLTDLWLEVYKEVVRDIRVDISVIITMPSTIATAADVPMCRYISPMAALSDAIFVWMNIAPIGTLFSPIMGIPTVSTSELNCP